MVSLVRSSRILRFWELSGKGVDVQKNPLILLLLCDLSQRAVHLSHEQSLKRRLNADVYIPLSSQMLLHYSFLPKALIQAMIESSCSCDAFTRNLSTSFLLLSSVISELLLKFGSESMAFCFASLDI